MNTLYHKEQAGASKLLSYRFYVMMLLQLSKGKRMSNALDFIYHSNCDEENFITNPSPSHLGGKNGATDFGTGFYLSDDINGSYIWGSRHENPPYGTMNIYDISPNLLQLKGLELTESYDDIMYWAFTTGKYLGYLPQNYASSNYGKMEDKYKLTTGDYDWVLARRVDDKMFDYLGLFFDTSLSFQGLVQCYDQLSFGNELVLKTQAAIDCFKFNANLSHSFPKSSYMGRYEREKQQANTYFDSVILQEYSHLSGHICIDEIVRLYESGEDWTQYV